MADSIKPGEHENRCMHSRTAIRSVIIDRNPDRVEQTGNLEKLLCLDCGEEVDFSPTIFVPDSFLNSLHEHGNNQENLLGSE